jgi:hypothetical protein
MEGLTSPFYDKDWPLWHFIASCISGYTIAIWSFCHPFLRHRRAGPLAIFAFAVTSAHIINQSHSYRPCPLVPLVVDSTLQLRLALQPSSGAAGWNVGGSP